jgi:hypothetical protein
MISAVEEKIARAKRNMAEIIEQVKMIDSQE